jgi:putative membrane protein
MTLPLLIVTLGLFTFVLNALMLWLTGAVSDWLGLGFQVEGFGAAFLGAVVVSVVSFMLSLFVASNRRQPQGDD